MTATTQSILRVSKVIRRPQLTLLSGQKVYQNTIAAFNGTGKIVGPSAATTLLTIGRFVEDYDASATGANADMNCVVDLGRDVNCEAFVNDTVNAVTTASIGNACYLLDNQTVTIDPTSHSIAGRVWAVDATEGLVYVQVLETVTTSTSNALASTLDTATANFTGNDWAPAAGTLVSGTTFVIGSGSSLGANSTLTLPGSGVAAGTTVSFAANAAQGAYTVTIRMGTTAITSALTASKRWMAKAVNVGDASTSIWVVDYTIDAN
jgi:hypothetical protein